MEDGKEVENDRQRAEVFDALGHSTRILILKALSEGALGFAELKKKTAIESSGHLQHHLTKLNGLIKTDEYGKYCLSEQGKDALLTVQTVENASVSGTQDNKKIRSHRFSRGIALKSVSLLLAALLIASSAIAILEYNQITHFNGNYEAAVYYNEFGVIPITNVNASFSPPVSMYSALQIGLEAHDWNKTSLDGMRVGIYLMPWETFTNTSSDYWGGGIPSNDTANGDLTIPPADYSDVYVNGVIYRYVWQIDIQKGPGITIPPWDLILVDAATGQILPKPPLF